MSAKMEFKGLEELKLKLTDPSLVGKPTYQMLHSAAKIGSRAATDGISGGTGIAERSIGSEVKPLSARVYTAIAQPRAMSIEQGREPGVNPRDILPQIIRWKDAVGHADSGIEIALDIERRGAKGKHFMQRAREVVNQELPRLLSEMGRRIREAFGR